ncbi:unnamed protein product [Paramecium sonneborni]|uniref:Uncharacterized protein n=1 Tax=Paramecium sonneborni TaxID=65129 RepID=A0A8S1QDJ0_9CILI|nr:unnamed protein product [Paramecium sonneborni]
MDLQILQQYQSLILRIYMLNKSINESDYLKSGV